MEKPALGWACMEEGSSGAALQTNLLSVRKAAVPIRTIVTGIDRV